MTVQNLQKIYMTFILCQCTQHWCPGVRGPCIDDNKDATYSVVYCRENAHCESLMLPNNVSGICELQGKGAAIQVGGSGGEDHAGEYNRCLHDVDSDVWSWELVVCSPNELFDGEKCSGKCEKEDNRGEQWSVPYDTVGVKDCPEGQGASQGSQYTPLNNSSLFIIINQLFVTLEKAYWACDGAGQFNTTQPDRTECVDEWIDNVSDEV
jgi:hypothetical protein